MVLKTLYDLIKSEDELVRRREVLDDMIVDYLYEQEGAPDKTKKKILEDKLSELKAEKEQVDKQLDDVRSTLKNRIFALLQK